MIKKSMEMLRLFVLTLFFIFSSGPVFSQAPTPTPTYTPTPTLTPTPGGPVPVPFGSVEGYAILFGTTAILGIWFILRHKREE